jgi:hypothetical protein
MINRHTTFFTKDIKRIEFCGKPVMWQMDTNGAFELPFEIEPTTGEHDFNTCEVCQKNLKELIKRLTEKFEGKHKDGAKPFPFCCTPHSELTKLKGFNRADFISVPEMVARKIIYTNQHIINNHRSENWYKVITDYIEWVIESFGQMPGKAEPLYLSDYFFYITNLLERNTDIEKGRKNRLLEFLKACRTPTKKRKTDLNVLLGTYQKWLKIFPFEISFFAHLKPYFEKYLPILNGEPEVNIYSGVAKVKMHTKSSLFDVLLNLTNNLLTQINTATLYEKGLLTEPQKIKLELILNERKMKLKQGYVNSSKDEEQRYRKILKEWFADEKRFIDEITPLLKALPPQPTETKTDKITAPVLGLFCTIINKIGIDKRDETESATVYCKRICDKFKLPYTDRVRQNYNVNENKKLIQELTEKVLPLIGNETKILIQQYLDNKKQPKQNLYA